MAHQHILIVDNEAPMRKLLTSHLEMSGYAVQAAADGTEALQVIDEYPFDLVLIEINVPGPNGFRVLEWLRRTADTPVLIVSERCREQDKLQAFNLGADDYVTKPFGTAEVLARVKALLKRATNGPRPRRLPLYRYQGLEVDFGARCVRLNGGEVPLTALQFKVLAYLAQNAGKILLHRQVLQAVWGAQYGDEAPYVWSVVQRIRQKIEPDRSAPRYLLTENGVGYRMPVPDEAPVYERQVDRGLQAA